MPGIRIMLNEQFNRMWKLLSEVIVKTPNDIWGKDLRSLHASSRLAFHTVETVDFYIGETETNFPWGKKFGEPLWETFTESKLPTKAQVKEYADEMKKKVETIFAKCNDIKFLEPQKIFSWTGETLLDRFVYILKHSYYHLGQINQLIKESGNEPTDWY
ncbi:MAG: DinB family protein [Candidatus Hodarchaeota archaeon]